MINTEKLKICFTNSYIKCKKSVLGVYYKWFSNSVFYKLNYTVPHFNLTVISDASDAIIFLVSLTNVFLYFTYLYTIIISRPVNCIMILIIICFLRNI